MTVPVIPFAEAEARMSWHALTEALVAGHALPKATLDDTFLYRGDDTLLSRSAWISGLGIAVKSATIFPGNKAAGLGTVNGGVSLYADTDGLLQAIIDFHLVTKWKTAGDSLLGARLLARTDARRLLIVGAGAVARSLVEAYRAGFPGIAITVWNRSADKARALADELGLEVAEDLAAAVPQADIVACCTMAKTPVLKGEWLRPGQHVDLIGAFTKDMREADDEALRRARIFVDSRETTLDHIGELTIPLADGTISRGDVLGDFYQLVDGSAGRESDADITLFKNGGGAHLDLMTGRYILAALG